MIGEQWAKAEKEGEQLRAAHRVIEWDGWEEGLVAEILGDEDEDYFSGAARAGATTSNANRTGTTPVHVQRVVPAASPGPGGRRVPTGVGGPQGGSGSPSRIVPRPAGSAHLNGVNGRGGAAAMAHANALLRGVEEGLRKKGVLVE